MASSKIAECRADMAAVNTAVQEVLTALGSVPAMFGDKTWQGPAADRWASEWNARRSSLKALLDAVLTEQPHLIARQEETEGRRAAS